MSDQNPAVDDLGDTLAEPLSGVGDDAGGDAASALDAADAADSDAPGDSVVSERSAGELGALAKEPRFKRPQSVLVVVCTRGGECLMLRRANPNRFWQSVTGSLRAGETPRSAALRELHEETGLRAGGALLDLRRSVLFPIVAAWRACYAPSVRFNREYWFALILETRRLIRLDPREHTEYRWLPAGRAAAMAGSWTNREAILALMPH